jgi:hypothetical protein
VHGASSHYVREQLSISNALYISDLLTQCRGVDRRAPVVLPYDAFPDDAPPTAFALHVPLLSSRRVFAASTTTAAAAATTITCVPTSYAIPTLFFWL